ncbi:MAG: 1-acyl-sn-glycerol-3-phosphate acyltransferase [Candidatus Shapirobacteria bacterium]|nr:1-acyl-sn-glycerol-3-phosphate acyltransferase [Candidatus Shapirobacteria bacterium]
MVKNTLTEINKNIKKLGVVGAVRKFIKKCNTQIVVQSSREINQILKKASGIIVANHPAQADVLAILAAVKKRKDIYLIIDSSLKKIIPELDKHLIPVFIYNKPIRSLGDKLKMKIVEVFYKIPKYPPDKERQKNIKSINRAIKKINNGGLVIIFPDGGNPKHNWFNGVGRMIYGIKNEKSVVIRAYIEGTSNWDYLRLIPFIGKFLPKFKISFAKPIKIVDMKKNDPKEITLGLENKYWKWRGCFQLWSKLSRNNLWLKMLFIFLINKPY